MASLPPPDQYRALVKRLSSSNYLLNKQLQHICQVNGLRTSGVKAELQRRILDALEKAYRDGDTRAYREIEQSVHREKGIYAAPNDSPSTTLPTPTNHAQQAPVNMNSYGYQNGYPEYGGQRSQQMPSQVMQNHRNCVSVQIRALDNPQLSQCATDKSMRVMVFCAMENTGVQDIAFPHQSELKVNGGDVKANLRGLKNKPGSTRPVDITDLLRLKIPNYSNNIEFTYALTNKAGYKVSQSNGQKFYLVVYICKTVPVDNLVQSICGRKISKASVLLELTRKAHDAEIEMSSQVLSLKCPLSYVKDILDNTTQSVEKVDIEPDGQWKAHGEVEDVVKPESHHEAFDLDDDDLVEVDFVGNRGTNTPNTLAPTPNTPTPGVAASREGSSMPRSGNKRSHAEVIDLTLSDEDEPPQPPAKRLHYRTSSAYPPSYS
ncbi:E3 SUMO-protein ligase pli1 [Cytospora mali]|uniref:E3 SUMO-protein ligase pli1 n=1 Tax=Cytospora mali TaxID=578113 RepID=A0A194VKJ2_CYTMA|nr:E3 SUMO-protein ligase pli1 [Valsa mali]